MIKLVDILNEIEDESQNSLGAKQQVLNYLAKRGHRMLPGTLEDRTRLKLIKDTETKTAEELQNYFKAVFLDRKNSIKMRYLAADVLDRLEGKKPW